MSGYLMMIRNELGSLMYLSPIAQEPSTIDIKNWSQGVYIVQIYDNRSALIDTRKMIIK